MMLLIPWSVWQFLKSIQHTFSCCDVGLIKFHRPRLPQGGHLIRSRVLWIWRDSSREMNQESKYVQGRKWSFSLRMQGSEELIGEVRRWTKGEATRNTRLQCHSLFKRPLSTPAQTTLSHLHIPSLTPGQRWASHLLGPLGVHRKGYQEMGPRAGHSQLWILNTKLRKSVFISRPASVDCAPQKIYIKAIFYSKCIPKKYICRKNVKCI